MPPFVGGENFRPVLDSEAGIERPLTKIHIFEPHR